MSWSRVNPNWPDSIRQAYSQRDNSGFPYQRLREVALESAADDKTRKVAWEGKNCGTMMASAVYFDRLLFAMCIDAATGGVKWKDRLGGGRSSASPGYADGLVYFLTEDGNTTVVEVKGVLKKLARSSVGETYRASMAVSRKQLFLRTDKHLWCIGK